MNEKPTDMCSFVNNWGFLSLIRYNSVSYIYWIGVYLFAYFYKIIELISPKLEGIEIYQRLKPIGRDLYKEIVRYLVFM